MSTDIPAGRELDALVAEKVMGLVPGKDFGEWPEHQWRRNAKGEIDYVEQGERHGGPVCDRCEFGYCQHCPGEREEAKAHPCEIEPDDYSTDIAAAWQVVERLLTMDPERIQFSIESRYPEWTVNTWCRAEDNNVCVVAETAPLAICRAALRAVGAT